jgi:hypothetical protein
VKLFAGGILTKREREVRRLTHFPDKNKKVEFPKRPLPIVIEKGRL